MITEAEFKDTFDRARALAKAKQRKVYVYVCNCKFVQDDVHLVWKFRA
jgi:hypothetical protein